MSTCTATLLKETSFKDSYDAIIIGTGASGLSTASFLAKSGKSVLVLEQHYSPGGYTHVFKRKGFEWDTGLHYLGKDAGSSSAFFQLYDYISDGQLKFSDIKGVYDRFVFPDRTINLEAGRESYRTAFYKAFPKDSKAVDLYMDAVAEVIASFGRFILTKALPTPMIPLLYPWLAKEFTRHTKISVYDKLLSFTSNKELIGALCGQCPDYGLPPRQASFAMHALVADHYMEGATYPSGGSNRFPETIISVITKNGGQVVLRAKVEKIVAEANKIVGVETADGRRINSKTVVSSAGFYNTYFNMLDATPEVCEFRDSVMSRVQPSKAHICVYLGFRDTTAVKNHDQSNIWVFPGYDHDQNLKNFETSKTKAPPFVWISFPSLKDDTWETRYPGRHTANVMGNAPYDWFKKWQNTSWKKRGQEYEDAKAEVCANIMTVFAKQCPDLSDKIHYQETSSPLSTRHFTGYSFGEAYGLNHTPERFSEKGLTVQGRYHGLFMTGQDLICASIPAAVASGALTAATILKKKRISMIKCKTVAQLVDRLMLEFPS